ncbi:MAG: thioesterase family protein [Rhodospirillales bacterium]|nr:thioesterase family protein [Rhodospirillales bacterium]
MTDTAPFPALRTHVLAEHVDHNGHMGIRAYTRLFDEATTPFYVHLGISRDAVKNAGGTIFALQDTAWYRREVMQGDPLLITGQLIDFDNNKVVSFLTMQQMRDDYVAACFEIIEVFIDWETRKPGAFPETIMTRLAEVQAEQSHLERPRFSGRGVELKRK